MKRKKYVFDGAEYTNEQAVRVAIYKKDRLAFGNPKTPEDWLKLGVTFTEEDLVVPIRALKEEKSYLIKQEFLLWREQNAVLVSSLGFVADSNERANTDVSGLIITSEGREGTITFRDADNNFHELTREQLKVLQKEIIENGSYAYFQKWHLDNLVDCAETQEDLEAIVINYEGKDFS